MYLADYLLIVSYICQVPMFPTGEITKKQEKCVSQIMTCVDRKDADIHKIRACDLKHRKNK